MKKIILIGLSLSIFLLAENFEKRDSFIYDKTTELLWEEMPSKNSMNWNEAMKHCTSQKLRLPNLNELSSLLDYSTVALATRTNKIHFISYDQYWTSSPYKDSSSIVWNVNIYGGSNGTSKKEEKGYVICVDG